MKYTYNMAETTERIVLDNEDEAAKGINPDDIVEESQLITCVCGNKIVPAKKPYMKDEWKLCLCGIGLLL